MESFIAHHITPLGPVTMASDGSCLTGLWFDGQKYFGGKILVSPEERDLEVFESVRCWLDEYFAGKTPSWMPKLKLHGSDFQLNVWQCLLRIPYGKTTTYGRIAAEVASVMNRSGMSAQAVGGAVGHNPISIIVPCHRVVGAHGQLTGYAGGLERKMALLNLERIL